MCKTSLSTTIKSGLKIHLLFCKSIFIVHYKLFISSSESPVASIISFTVNPIAFNFRAVIFLLLISAVLPSSQPFSNPITSPFSNPFSNPITSPFSNPFSNPISSPFSNPTIIPSTLPSTLPSLLASSFANS